MRTRREVLQPRAQRDHDVRFVRERVGGRSARHADRSRLQRMVPRERALPRLRFGDRYAVRFGEAPQRVGAAVAVQNAAARDDQRLPRRAEHSGGGIEVGLLGHRRANAHERRREEVFRIVVRLRLDVLRQRERHGPALRGIGQHRDRPRQRGQELRRRLDPIEVARHRPEAVVGRDAAVVEVLDLLQHRIGRPRNEHVARQEQHRQPVDVRGRRRGDQIGRPRADRRRARHHPAAEVRLRVGDRRVRHRLLVVGAVRRQRRAMPVQRLADAGDVAVTEDRPHAAEQRNLASVADGSLRGEKADQRLRHRQADRAHRDGSFERTAVHASISASKFFRTPLDESRVVELAREPRARRLVEDRAPHRKAAARAAPRRVAEAPRQLVDRCGEAQQHDAATIGVALGDERVDRRPLGRAGRRQLPPLGEDAEVVEPLHRAKQDVRTLRQPLRRHDLDQELVPARLHRVVERLHLRLVLQAVLDVVVRVERDEALDHLLDRPRDERGADRAAVLEDHRIRSGPLDRATDPPAAAGRGVERVLAVAVVAQDADAPRKTAGRFRLGHRAHEELLERRQAAFGRARRARELEERIAMVEREDEELRARRARRGPPVQAGQHDVAVGARDRRRVGEVVVELDARGHRRRAAVARHDQRAAGVRVAAAGVVILAAKPAGQEARRERVAGAEHVQHLDGDAAPVERLVERARNRAVDHRAAHRAALDDERRRGDLAHRRAAPRRSRCCPPRWRTPPRCRSRDRTAAGSPAGAR